MKYLQQMAFVAILLIAGSSPGRPAGEPEAPAWPREYAGAGGGKLVMYQPQITGWEGFSVLDARIAIAFTGVEGADPSIGAFDLRADTEADLPTRQVRLSNLRIVGGQFPSLNENDSDRLLEELRVVLPAEPVVISLDRILSNLDRGAAATRTLEWNNDPPVIFVSSRPAILILIDGQPLLSAIPDTGIKYVLNTNWDLFQYGGFWYLLNGEGWLQAPDLGVRWSPVEKLPKDFKKLPKKDDNWTEVRNRVPGRTLKPEEIPVVFVSEAPAEMILTDGEPNLGLIEATHLLWVTNTGSDLFLSNDDGHFYYLVSGRWFRADNLDGPWLFATTELPDDFRRIPADHPRGRVLSAVPGTPEADQAVLLAQIPTRATVKKDLAAPEVTYEGDPQFESIEGTELLHAVNTPFDVIQVGELYYLCYQAVWFFSSAPIGPWQVSDFVPAEIYEIPANSPIHNTTYVYIYDSSPTWVVYGYTAGYYGVYYSYGSVWFGTGWYYPPYIYWGSYYPVYYPYHYSYGVGAWYNPYTGTYGRGAVGYGPYGGTGRGAAYNPQTGTYARGGVAWGPYQARGWAEAYNPHTGTHAATRQGGNLYASWGTTAVSRGDDWVRTGHYQNAEGGIVGYRTSEGTGGFVGRRGDDLYAGRDGNVYRRDDSGNWHQYENGNWSEIDRPPSSDRARDGDRRDRVASGESPGSTPGDRDRVPPGDRAGAGDRSRDFDRDRVGDRDGGDGNRGTYDQLDRDARSRDRGSSQSRDYNAWQSGGTSRYGRGTTIPRTGGGRGRGRR